MAGESRSHAIAKFPLRLMPSVRQTAETYSAKEGVSLNQFINVAVAEKLARLEHQEWLRRRGNPDQKKIDRVLKRFREAEGKPEPGDELPSGYVSVLKRGDENRVRRKSA
jgi:hypothetical protein